MNLTFQLDKYYQFSQKQFSAFESSMDKTSKLSLFSDQNIDKQQENLIQLLSSFEHSIVFKLMQVEANYCWELYASYSVLTTLKKQLINSIFDYLFWPENSMVSPELLVFDMDSTFIQIEVIDELAKCHQVGDQVIDITEAAMRGELDFSESLIARVKCLKGLGEDAIEKLAQALPLSPGIESLVNLATKNNCKIAIVSGGFTPFVKKVQTDMQLYQVKANDLAVKSGELTGELVNINQIVDAKAKADFIESLCEELSLAPEQTMAIGDGANDLLMMEKAGFSLAYRAKPKVEQQANGRMKYTHLNQLSHLFGWA